jgi:hypothetical protein
VSVPRVRRGDQAQQQQQQRRQAGPPASPTPRAQEGEAGPPAVVAAATTPPPPPPPARQAAVRSSADALRHLASFAALTTENARSPTPGAAVPACSPPPLRRQGHCSGVVPPQQPSSPLRESTASINCGGAAQGGVVVTAVASPRMG